MITITIKTTTSKKVITVASGKQIKLRVSNKQIPSRIDTPMGQHQITSCM
jgi:hypothetical protein